MAYQLLTDAINQFEELKRELTNLSRKMTTDGKVEEGSPDTFDLTQFLHGVSKERGSAGLQEKRLGLIWKNLTVKVRSILRHHEFNRASSAFLS
jgi:ABC-transporter N-terminal